VLAHEHDTIKIIAEAELKLKAEPGKKIHPRELQKRSFELAQINRLTEKGNAPIGAGTIIFLAQKDRDAYFDYGPTVEPDNSMFGKLAQQLSKYERTPQMLSLEIYHAMGKSIDAATFRKAYPDVEMSDEDIENAKRNIVAFYVVLTSPEEPIYVPPGLEHYFFRYGGG